MKVMVGISGGVDSSVAAFLLKRQGHEVVGATFAFGFGGPDPADAKAVCDRLGIAHHVFDFSEVFRRAVVDDFAQAYMRGETPNPCVRCNVALKFGALLDKARELGCDKVATGHYATVEYDENRGRYRVRRADFLKKDQSYVLYGLSQRQLEGAVLPLGSYDKPQVRELAGEHGLLPGPRPESQDICFVPDGDYARFLEDYLGKKPEPGDFVGADGRVLGRHRGIWHYTVGQRKGLGLSFDRPMFVASIDAGRNTVALAENDALFSRSLTAGAVNWIDFDRLDAPARFCAKIRYGAQAVPATVSPMPDGGVSVLFDEAQRAATPGQSVVFYDGDYVAGGGVIRKDT